MSLSALTAMALQHTWQRKMHKSWERPVCLFHDTKKNAFLYRLTSVDSFASFVTYTTLGCAVVDVGGIVGVSHDVGLTPR
eukprot:m.508772 g.508772  ORF g.508772 m.508772 type:complete len:80 (-) comp21886_c0_seq2:1487-1726(-)